MACGSTRTIEGLLAGTLVFGLIFGAFARWRAHAFAQRTWIAYEGDDTGTFEILVLPSPGPGGRVTVSPRGGLAPRWSTDGRELFYPNGKTSLEIASHCGARGVILSVSVLPLY